MSEQTNDTPKYPHPEPKLYDLWFWSLLIPAAIYVLGVIVYGGQALMPQVLTWASQGFGSLLMVVGGEIGTLFTVMEVYRKDKAETANRWDWLGLIVSLVSTLGILFVVFARQTALDVWWVGIALEYGPLALLLCSGLDFYANLIELGYYRASFDARTEKYHTEKYLHEVRWRNKLRKELHADTDDAPIAVEIAPELTPEERQLALLALWTEQPDATQAQAAAQFGVTRQTISGDFKSLRKAGKARRNAHGIEVLTEH